MNKRVLFLEDNLSGVGSLVTQLRYLNVDCAIMPDLNAWKAELKSCSDSLTKIDLLVLDDNIYKEPTLEKLGRADIGTNNGSSTGSKIAVLLRSVDAPEFLQKYKDTPIIIYSVHSPENIISLIGDLKDVYIQEKLRGEEIEQEMLNICKEILELET